MAEQEVRDLLKEGHDIVGLRIFLCKRKSLAYSLVSVIVWIFYEERSSFDE